MKCRSAIILRPSSTHGSGMKANDPRRAPWAAQNSSRHLLVGLRCPATDFEQVCGAAQAALRISRVVSDVVRAHGVAGGRYGEICAKSLMRQNPQQKATWWLSVDPECCVAVWSKLLESATRRVGFERSKRPWRRPTLPERTILSQPLVELPCVTLRGDHD